MSFPQNLFILGAGFSKSFCNSIPTISSLTQLLFDEKSDEETKYPKLCEFVRNAYKHSRQNNQIRDIENIATVILTKKIFIDDIEKAEYDILRYEVLKFISDKLKGYSCDENKKETLIKFLKLGTPKRSINELICPSSYLTFNYDLIVEETGTWVDYGLIRSYPSHFIQDTLGHPIDYVKLHGSLNWYSAKGTTGYEINNTYIVAENNRNFPIHSKDVPVFVPMAHAKDSFLVGSLFSSLWAKAIRYFENAVNVYFLGYSFPISDMNNLFLFMKFKNKIKRIVVYYENPTDPNFKRLVDIFGEEIVINMDAKAFIEQEIFSG